MLAGNAANAQTVDKENNIAVSYGFFTTAQVAYTFGAVFGTAFSFGLGTLDNMHFTGGIGLEYYHSLGKHWEIGGLATFEHCTADKMSKNLETGEYYKTGELNANMFSIGPVARIRWVIKPAFNFYSKAAVGLLLNTSKDSEEGVGAGVAFQLVPVGFEAGSQTVRGFLELGCGMTGLVAGGVRFRF